MLTIEDSQHKVEVIYSNYSSIENILNVVNSARNKDYSFKDIGKILKKAKKDGMAEAQIYESIDKLGVLTLNIDDTSLIMDPKLTIPENAEAYYEKAKKAKRKTKGALIAIENTKKQLEKIRSKKDIAMEQVSVPKKRVKKNLKWYEKLRWFISSDNILVIGGPIIRSNSAPTVVTTPTDTVCSISLILGIKLSVKNELISSECSLMKLVISFSASIPLFAIIELNRLTTLL